MRGEIHLEQFLNQIDKKATKKNVISKLQYLKKTIDASNYTDYKTMQSESELLIALKEKELFNNLNDEKNRLTLLDFLPSYTRSIVAPPTGSISKNASDIKLLNAIEKHDQAISIEKSKRLHIQWLLAGIAKLDPEERKLIIDKYIFKLTDAIMSQKNGISKRTLYRLLDDAYLNLAIIWNLEVKKERNNQYVSH